MLHRDGRGVERDYRKAHHFFEHAAKQGYEPAIAGLQWVVILQWIDEVVQGQGQACVRTVDTKERSRWMHIASV